MSNAIIDGTKIDTSVFSYSAPKANPSGGKVVNLYNKHFKESLTLSTPLMLTWGAQEGMDQARNPTGKYTMSLQFPNSEYTNADAEAFLKSMRTLESKIRADALAYSKEWFGKEIKSADVMEEKFNVGGDDDERDFSKAKTLVLFCNGMWCGQSPNNIKSLLKMGYPADKIKWYRGGMQDWEVLGLTTVPGK